MITFVSGIDTDAGKSIATGWLARRWLAEGRRVVTQKFVQTGNTGASEDIARHRALMACGDLPEDAERLTAPEIYSYPCSPHLAARLDRRPLDLPRILAAAEELARRYDEVLVEGAGGLMVPLAEGLLTLDVLQRQGWPLVFVTGGALGSISQTLLAFEALRARAIPVARIVYNRFPGRADRLIDDDTCATLRQTARRLFPDALWEELPILDLRPAPARTPPPPPGERPIRKTFPANLLLEGKTTLVAGGGRVGLRKTQALLDAGATVRLVSPEALPEFDGLPVERRPRPFTPEDLDGCAVAFACTSDKAANRAVLEAARAGRIPCCCADGRWTEGDFIVPATLRTPDLLVAVSTNGRSCRTAKEVKDALARRLARSSPGKLYIHGIDAAVPLPPRRVLSDRLAFLNGLYGWAFLATCNRTELIAWASPELIASGLLPHALHLPQGAYALSGDDAMRHLSLVLAGMRAKMTGEFHIVGQVRDAIEEARAAGWAHGPLQAAYAEALRRANAVRAAVAPLLPDIEVESLALEGARERVVIAGTGRLGQAAAAKAHALGLDVTLLYHAHPLDGEDCRPLAQWREALQGANRFLACLAVPEPLFEAAEIPVPAFDLGAPRNIRGEEGVRDLDALRNDYLRRTGSLDALLAAAEEAYEEASRG